MARPSKLTSEVQESIVESVEQGLTFKQAAQLAGIDETTLHRWKRKGEKAISGKFYQFCLAIKRANLKARLILLERIEKAGEGGQVSETVTEIHDANGKLIRRITVRKELPPVWQASAWILERRFPSEFGRNARPVQEDENDPLQQWIDALVEAESKFNDK